MSRYTKIVKKISNIAPDLWFKSCWDPSSRSRGFLFWKMWRVPAYCLMQAPGDSRRRFQLWEPALPTSASARRLNIDDVLVTVTSVNKILYYHITVRYNNYQLSWRFFDKKYILNFRIIFNWNLMLDHNEIKFWIKNVNNMISLFVFDRW